MSKKKYGDERAKLLADYIGSISGDMPVEEFMQISQDHAGLESLSSRDVKKSTDAVERMMRGSKLSDKDLFGLEAIVHKTKRPSHRVEGGSFAPFPGEFEYLTDNSSIKKNINSSFDRIGRIDTPERPIYGGTGFVVGQDLVMTNRHVAELFTQGVGRDNVRITLRNSEIDFREEPENVADGFRLLECVMVHPYWDMAIFKADLPKVDPLELSIVPYEELLDNGQAVVVIGYPARDTRNARDVQQDIFGSDFEIKRIAPGRVAERTRPIGSRWLGRQTAVDALAHDASTLGGNSGSAVINVDTGQVVALHFAGRYLVENYAVPCHELARDPRVVDTGINFDASGSLPDENPILDRYWDSVGDEDRPASRPPKKRSTRRTATRGSSATLEVPLKITVTLGEQNVVADIEQGADDDQGTESIGEGYDSEFLSESVPTPKLSCEQKDDAFFVDDSHLIHYTHFSVCQSKSRTLPRFVAWNIDGGRIKTLSRKHNRFVRDRRVPDEFQAGNELYKNNPYDRGHVARRVDLNWGTLSEAKRANKDSFFFTNMTPQHERFNQSSRHGLWGRLENAILEDIEVEDLKVSVIAGPIFRDDDPLHRGVGIPRDYWKLIAFRDTDDDLFKVSAYILSQAELIPTEALELDMFQLYHTSLSKLSEETDLDFDDLLEFDTFADDHESVSGSGLREIVSARDLII